MNNKTAKRIKPILEMYKIEKQNFDDFLKACPYPLEDLQQDKRQEQLVYWRHLGALFATLKAGSVTDGAKLLNKNHATLLHSFKNLECGYPEFYENLELINLECEIRLQNESVDKVNMENKINQLALDVDKLQNKANQLGLEIEINYKLKV